jgi:intracellular sulfur oxidation DsrE/DsrF family protein
MFAQSEAASATEPLTIDIPATQEKANIVVNLDHADAGDMPFVLGHINPLADDPCEWNEKGQVVVIFHGDAAYLILNNEPTTPIATAVGWLHDDLPVDRCRRPIFTNKLQRRLS